MANGIEELARQMLRVAYRKRRTMSNVHNVITPRDVSVMQELGYEIVTDNELKAAEQWLENMEFITPLSRAAAHRYKASTRSHGGAWPSWKQKKTSLL